MRIYQGFAGHFICGYKCYFRLNTVIDKKYIISTVGDMRDHPEAEPERIGCDRFYETMVFTAKECDCGCAGYVVDDLSEIDMTPSDNYKEAAENHEAMCQKYEEKA